MSHSTQSAGGTAGPSYQGVRSTEMTAWTGWIAFGASMMVLLGVFHAIAGLVALFRDEYFLVGSNGLLVNVDYTTWGWAHLVGGGVMVAAGIALFTGQVWARVVAVFVAMVSALTNIAFLAAYPIWSTIMVALDVLVIWAVLVHGSEMREE